VRLQRRPRSRRQAGTREALRELVGRQHPDVRGVDDFALLRSKRAELAFTSAMSNAAAISSIVNTSRSAAIDQPSSAR